MKPKTLLVTGGSRSGKTAHALERAMRFENRIYLATAEAIDEEMVDRIDRHQAERGDDFKTVEEPLDLAGALNRIPEGTGVVLIDCMTVWLGNLMHKNGVQKEPYTEVRDFLTALETPPCNIVIVTNELGSGIIPHDAMTRTYRDHAGWLNQDIAKIADEVLLVACGLPLTLKILSS
ncbi:MAG: bifunctional adenosylcobinamide kinase/adenosylcobinamide-phosphate guanylyltransferase [Verrucomicrobiota bacterium]